ncbi:MAG: hypothetical protein KAI89_02560 [Emcibacter sp.]|nr:hypothetical protein [Emcibacter sp.]
MVFLRRNKKNKDAAYALFTEIVAQSRMPHFYSDWGIADTLDGRFDLIILHVSLVVRRFEKDDDNKQMALLIRHLREVLFENMDMSLREIGVGDMSIGKKVKVMAEAYYGRAAAYAKAIQSDDIRTSLKSALIRNIYREQPPEDATLDDLMSYVMAQIKCLDAQKNDDFLQAKITFEKAN